MTVRHTVSGARAGGRFHDPCDAREREQPGIKAEFKAVVDLVLRGLGV
jgi:hypothetical protein